LTNWMLLTITPHNNQRANSARQDLSVARHS